MDNARLAWQKSIWICLTIEGDRKKLITPAQRTSSGLACRKIFHTQFVQLMEAYDTYGPDRGNFVPRLEPSTDSQVGFEIYWDKLGDVLVEKGTAPTSTLEQSAKEALTINSILESHRQRKRRNMALGEAEQLQSDFAESQCTTASGPAMPDLTPSEMSARATTELERRTRLLLRERNGEIEGADSTRPAHMRGLRETLNELESYISRMQFLLKACRQEQLKACTSISEVAEQDVLRVSGNMGDALECIKRIRGWLVRPPFGSWETSNKWAFDLYRCNVGALERAVTWYSTYAPPAAPSQSPAFAPEQTPVVTSALIPAETISNPAAPASNVDIDVHQMSPQQDLPALQMFTRAEEEYKRREKLAKRERTGILEPSAPGTPRHVAGIEEVFDDLEQHANHLKKLIRSLCQEQLQGPELDSQEADDVLEALDRIESLLHSTSVARVCMQSRDYILGMLNYSGAITFLRSVTNFYARITSSHASKAPQ